MLWQKTAVFCDTGQKLRNIAARRKKALATKTDADKAGLKELVCYVDLV